MFKKIHDFLNKRVALLLRIVAVVSILLGGVFLMISVEMFSHGQVFVFLGFISVLINAIGITSGILILIRVRNELGVSLLRNFAIIGLIFVLFYSIIGNAFDYPFLIIISIWIIIYLFIRTQAVIAFVSSEIPVITQFKPGHRYLRMHGLLTLNVFGSVIIFVLIWFVNWETQAKFYREPNGGGISNFVSEIESPRLSANVEGGFIYSVGAISPDYAADYFWNERVGTDFLLGEVKVKLVSPSAKIHIYPQESGSLRVNILNFNPNSIIRIDDEELKGGENLSREHWIDQKAISASIDEIATGRHLTRVRGIVFDIEVEVGVSRVIEIKPEDDDEPEMRFIVMSDLHSGYNIFMPEWANIIDFDPDFAIVNGDMTNLGYPSEYMMISAAFELSDFPVYTAIGNHDAWNSGSPLYNKYFGPNNYYFSYRDALFIFLDSSSGIFGETQFNWLESVLIQNEKEHIFVITHMPPIDTVTGVFDTSNTLHPESLFTIHSKSESDYFLYLMNQYDVDVVFAGHTHVHGMSVIDDTTYVTSGVLGGSVKPGNTIGYLEVVVSGSEVDIQLVDILSVEEARGKTIENSVQALRVFLMPFLINNSIRITLSLLAIVSISLLWIPLKRKLVIVIEKEDPASERRP